MNLSDCLARKVCITQVQAALTKQHLKGLGLEPKRRKAILGVQAPVLWIVSILSLQAATFKFYVTDTEKLVSKKSGMNMNNTQWAKGQAANMLDTHVKVHEISVSHPAGTHSNTTSVF